MGTGHLYDCIAALRPQQHVTLVLVILRGGESGTMQVPHEFYFMSAPLCLFSILNALVVSP
jgi:hypothetical protein